MVELWGLWEIYTSCTLVFCSFVQLDFYKRVEPVPLTPPPNGTFEVVVGGRDGHGNFALNRFIYTSSVPPTNETEAFAQAFDLATFFGSFTITPLTGCMGDDCEINILFARHIGTLGGSAAYNNIVTNGTFGTDSFSNVVAADVAWLPGGAGNNPGHTYVWGVPITGVDQGALQDALITALQAFAANMLIAIVGGVATYTFGILSRKLATVTPVTNGNVRPKLTGLNKRAKPFI